MSKELCLVTGATGSLGPELIRQLGNAGYAVRAFVRHAPLPGTFPEGVGTCTGDISDRKSIERAAQGTKIVFHLAAKGHLTNPGPGLYDEYWRINVEGTRNLVDACSAALVERLVYFSTINVYGATHGAYADERTIPHPDGIYAETKRAAEDVVLAARAVKSGQPLAVVLRLAAVYGPRMKGNYQKLLKALEHGLFVPVGQGGNRRTLVYEQDAARAAILAAQHPRAPGTAYNVSDGRIHCLSDIIAAMCAALGRTPPRFFLPTRSVRSVAKVVDGLAGLIGHNGNLTALVDKLVEDIAVRAERIQQELGFLPLIELEEGWRRTIAASQSPGTLPNGAIK